MKPSAKFIVFMATIAMLAIFPVGNLPAEENEPVYQVKMHNGAPTLFIDEKPCFLMAYVSYNPKVKTFRKEFADAGIHFHSLSTTASEHLYKLSRPVWTAPGTYDYTALDKAINDVFEADPDARLLLRLAIDTPAWWDKLHPEELVKSHDGGNQFSDNPTETKTTRQSFASELWKNDLRTALSKYIEHLKKSPHYPRIVGFQINSGMTEEWQFWGGQQKIFADYSQPALIAFRSWLKNKYQTDSALQVSWKNTAATLNNAGIPSKDERTSAGQMGFHDPAKSQSTIDYNQFHSELVADAIIYFSKIIKEATGGKKLAGAFYGYLLEHSGMGYSLQNCGHLALEKTLGSPDVDFLAGPASYAIRNAGDTGGFMTPVDSIKWRGKLWLQEADIRTHLLPPNCGFGRTNDLPDTLSVLAREFGMALAKGTAIWWFDMGGKWFSDPQIMKAIARFQKIAAQSLALDRSSVAQVAVIYDEKSVYRQDLRKSIGLNANLISLQRREFARMGAPCDTLMVNDLANPNLPDYKCYIFVNTFYLTSRQRAMIGAKCKKNGNTLVWLHAAGLIDENGPDTKNTETLTGIEKINLNLVSPDKLTEENLVSRDMGAWKSVHIPSSLLKAKMWRELCRSAGAHIYNETDDALYMNKHFMVIHSAAAGKRVIRFPSKTNIHDLLDDAPAGKAADTLAIDLPCKTTKIYLLN
ncbi:MAG: beta-galactosidase [Verrucomicrobiae bacterium]|nr:beta-galactosidase [Verrucomicrobiae bacterium]